MQDEKVLNLSLSVSKPGALRGSKRSRAYNFQGNHQKIYLSLGSNIKPEENLNKQRTFKSGVPIKKESKLIKQIRRL